MPSTATNSCREISVIVPVYNSQGTLRELTQRLCRVLEADTDRFEILLVNDGSADGSWAVIEELSRGDRRIRGIDLGRNTGQINALLRGFKDARYIYAITIDDDLQHPPEEIPKLISLM